MPPGAHAQKSVEAICVELDEARPFRKAQRNAPSMVVIADTDADKTPLMFDHG